MTPVRWRRPEPCAWEARCGRLVLVVYVEPGASAWTWQVGPGSWWEREVWDLDDAVSEETAIRDGLRALARAVCP